MWCFWKYTHKRTSGHLCQLVAQWFFIDNQAFAQDELLINNQTQWKYFAQSEKVDNAWNTKSFNDSKWKVGKAGFG